MSQLIYFGGAGGSQPANPDIDYEFLGWGADGSGTLATASASSFTKGAWVSLGVTTDDWCGFDLIMGAQGGSGLRMHIDIGAGASGSQAAIISNVYSSTHPVGTTMAPAHAEVPLQVAAGTELWARVSAQNGGATQKIALRGIVASAALPPGFTACTTLVEAASTGYAGPTNIAMDGTWALLHTTARDYGAILMSPSVGTTTLATQEIAVTLGLGEAGSEVEFYRLRVQTVNANPPLKTAGDRLLIERSIPSGAKISASCLAANTAGNPIRLGLHGFY